MEFAQACALLEEALQGTARREILDRALAAGSPDEALARMRVCFRSHVLAAAADDLRLKHLVESFDRRTQREGFHVLHEWDHAAQRFIAEDIAVLMLDYFGRAHLGARPLREALALLLDYYLLYVLALVLMRSWDEGDVNANLDQISRLLADLQGPRGSGTRFVDDAAALLFIAISHYEPDDLAYHRLLKRLWSLDAAQRLNVARVGGPLLASHLRWGFPALYERNVGLMREDNFSDYPWLFFSVATLADEYDRRVGAGSSAADREEVAAALLNALSPDPDAFLGDPPAALAEYPAEHARCRALLRRHRTGLLDDVETSRPPPDAYSPLGFQFNFPHNVLIARVVLGLMGGGAPNLSLNDLLAPPPPTGSKASAELVLARSLTAYSAAHPARQRNRPVLMIAYDPALAQQTFLDTLAALRAGRDG